MTGDVVFTFDNDSMIVRREEALRTLEVFAGGYKNTESMDIDSFYSRVFLDSPETYIIGTAPEEFFKGKQAIKTHILSEWENWGHLGLDVAKGVYTYREALCWFYVDGIVSMEIDVDTCVDDFAKSSKEILNSANPDRQACLSLVREMVNTVSEVAFGKVFEWPIRLTGVMVWDNTTFKIAQLHYSFPTSQFPDERVQ
jgi:hypothetical protein